MAIEKYKEYQVRLSNERHKEIIDWLEETLKYEESSFNSIIIRILKDKYNEYKVKAK